MKKSPSAVSNPKRSLLPREFKLFPYTVEEIDQLLEQVSSSWKKLYIELVKLIKTQPYSSTFMNNVIKLTARFGIPVAAGVEHKEFIMRHFIPESAQRDHFQMLEFKFEISPQDNYKYFAVDYKLGQQFHSKIIVFNMAGSPLHQFGQPVFTYTNNGNYKPGERYFGGRL